MFTTGIKDYLKDLAKMKNVVNWSLQCYPDRYVIGESYRKMAFRLSRSSLEGRDAYCLFETIVGFIDPPSKGGACIDVLKVKTDDNTWMDGYDYLNESEVELIRNAVDGEFDFTVEHFLQHGLRNTRCECRLATYLRLSIMDTLCVMT